MLWLQFVLFALLSLKIVNQPPLKCDPNEFAYDGETKNNNNLRKENGHVVKSFTENLEFVMHDIQLFGDSFLNAGRVVELKFPKVMDPQEKRNKLFNSDPSM